MKKKLVAGILVMSCLVGCGAEKPVIDPHSPSSTMTPLEDIPESTETVNKDTEVVEVNEEKPIKGVDLSDDNLTNSVNLVDLIAEQDDTVNIMLSPTSLNYALGMVCDGANGKTKEQISKYLGGDGFSSHAKGYLKKLDMFNSDDTINGYNTKFQIADALWVDETISLNDSYKDKVVDNYNAEVDTVNFKDAEKACSIINMWADINTNGLINEIISPSLINSSTKMCITNSVYFESAWSEPWNYVENNVETFTKANRDEIDCSYLKTTGNTYYENDNATAFGYDYMSGLKFIGILPKDKGNFNIADLDIKGLLNSKTTEYDVNMKMPKLNFETSADLTNYLSGMGVDEMFSDNADFSGVSKDPLKVDSVIQKTKLELDENGTKAAAVTAVMMMENACAVGVEKKVKEVNLDRPFAFLIYDEENNEVLFLGKVMTLNN